jgi:hypothetical protein
MLASRIGLAADDIQTLVSGPGLQSPGAGPRRNDEDIGVFSLK